MLLRAARPAPDHSQDHLPRARSERLLGKPRLREGGATPRLPEDRRGLGRPCATGAGGRSALNRRANAERDGPGVPFAHRTRGQPQARSPRSSRAAAMFTSAASVSGQARSSGLSRLTRAARRVSAGLPCAASDDLFPTRHVASGCRKRRTDLVRVIETARGLQQLHVERGVSMVITRRRPWRRWTRSHR